ncbi:MAG: hypothetical protein M3Q06_00490, partial [Bacteroidota bacterium]|nr:hypothetical protein [Bacteroidota bacterium]
CFCITQYDSIGIIPVFSFEHIPVVFRNQRQLVGKAWFHFLRNTPVGVEQYEQAKDQKEGISAAKGTIAAHAPRS